MNRTAVCAGFGFLFLVGLGMPGVQAQQPVASEPQAPSSSLQVPREAVPPLVVPRLVKFSGVAKDDLGRPRTGTVGITFAVYKDQEGGAALWMETQNAQLDEQGRYTVLLGSTRNEGLPLELFTSGEPRWLGAQVQLPGEVEQARVLLVSVPYALEAADAKTLGGMPPSAFMLAPTNVATPQTGAKSKAAGTATRNAAAASIGGGGTANVVTKFDATGANVINSSISDDGSRVTVGEGINFGSDFSFVGNAEPARTGAVQIFNRANVGFVLRGLNLLVETLQGSSFTPTEVMRWTQAGNVGIGSTNPGHKVEIIDTGNTGLRVQTNTTGGKVASFGGFGDFQIDAPNVFGGRFVVKDSSGFVGIGTTTPAALLHVGTSRIGLRVEGPLPGISGSQVAAFGGSGDFNIDAVGTTAGRFVVKDSSGFVGINNPSPGQQLDVVGNIRTNDCYLVNSTVVSGTCTSDVRMKTNIQPFSPVLNKLARLRPVHFEWRTADYPERHFDSSRSSGLIAQEVEKVMPELVSVDAQGFKRLNYTELPYLMLEAIRELKAQNDRLQSQVKELRAVVVRIAAQQAVERAAISQPRPAEPQ